MATNSIRWLVAKRIVAILNAHSDLVDVQVLPGWPGDEVANEAIWLGRLEGTLSYPVMSANRKYRDDQFTVEVWVRVAGLVDLDPTMERLEEVLGTVDDILADDPGLQQLDGVISAGVTNTLLEPPQFSTTGHVGFGQATVSVHARLE